ncbi:MAG: hypothetical protein MZU95_01100 [Desulfomicrobium escambiense]|nr:hypothetical protein [Desulfomicrobium escambiense]
MDAPPRADRLKSAGSTPAVAIFPVVVRCHQCRAGLLAPLAAGRHHAARRDHAGGRPAPGPSRSEGMLCSRGASSDLGTDAARHHASCRPELPAEAPP